MAKTLDRVDRRILEELQADARISNQDLAKRVGLSSAPCWRRLRRLEEEGFIASYATLLSPTAIGLPILAYAQVTLENHHPESVRQFDQLIAQRPEVLECHSMSGANDYLLRIVAGSIEAYEHFLSTHVLQTKAVRSLSSPRKVALTGTPVENHLGELWSIMEILNPALLGSATSFRERFVIPIERFRDEEAAEKLRALTPK